MADFNQTKKYLPLTEATYYILISLIEPLHGYGIMQNAEEMSGGELKLGPGTLYGALSKLEKEKLIVPVASEDRRKCYKVTDFGKSIIQLEFNRLKQLVKSSEKIIEQIGW